MSQQLPALLFLFPLFGSLLLFLWGKKTIWKRFAALIILFGSLILSSYGLFAAVQGEVMATLAGGWAFPFGIVLVMDLLSALLLTAVNLVYFSAALYSFFEQEIEEEPRGKLPLILLMQCGTTLTLLTGDFFNLFVAVEVMLCSSYALMALMGESCKLGRALNYVILSMTASFLFLVLAGSFYGYTGHLNMAAISQFLQGEGHNAFILAIAFLCLIIFGLKAGAFPLYFWLPDSYPILPHSLAGLFGGVLTKVGVYILIRLFVTVLPHDLTAVYTTLAWVAGLTMILGVIGAVGKNSIKGILSYHILSQTGYMLFALSLFTPAAIAAGIYFIIHNILVKSSLFILGGAGKSLLKSDSLDRLSGLWQLIPIGGFLFLIQALSLAGIPPFSGFWGKYLIIAEGVKLGWWALVAIALITSFLTLASMVKIWSLAYMGECQEKMPIQRKGWALSSSLLVAASLLMAFGAEFVLRVADKASAQLYDQTLYYEVANSNPGKGRLD